MGGSVNEAIKYSTMAFEADNCNDWTLEILGNCYVALSDFEKAEQCYNDLVSCRPTEALSYYNRGKFFFSQKKYDKALIDLTESVTRDKSNWMARYLRAMAYQEKNEQAKAIEDLDIAISINQKNSELWFFKAKCLLQLMDYSKALENAKKAKEMVYSSKSFGKDSFKNLFDINKIIKECEAKLN
jgi:tetratricopeptide (TPR) repeat protein